MLSAASFSRASLVAILLTMAGSAVAAPSTTPSARAAAAAVTAREAPRSTRPNATPSPHAVAPHADAPRAPDARRLPSGLAIAKRAQQALPVDTLPSPLDHAPSLIVYDWDGTIGDTYPQLRWIVTRAAQETGIALPTVAAGEDPLRAVIDGAGLEVMFRRIAPKGSAAQEKAFVTHFESFTREAPADLVKLKPGVRDELEKVRALHPDTKLAVLSSRPQWVIESFAKAAGVEGMFSKLVGTGGSKIAEKPSPEGLELITSALSVDPKHAIMVGDTPMDIGAGKAAGMHTVALRDGLGTQAKLAAAAPEYTLDSLIGFSTLVLPPRLAPVMTLRGKGFQTPPAPVLDDPSMQVHQALGVPMPRAGQHPNAVVLARQGYVSVFDPDNKIPLVVSWATTPKHLGESRAAWGQREDVFHEDTLLDAPQASLADYKGSGYHRGHLVRQGERPITLNRTENQSTFSMVNIIPQSPNNNLGPWSHFENFYRDQVFDTQKVAYVQAGPILEGNKTIGAGVTVPSHTYKIVVLADPGVDLKTVKPEDIGKSVKVFGVIIPNNNKDVRQGDHWADYIVPVSQIAKRTDLPGFLAGFANAETRKTAWNYKPTVTPAPEQNGYIVDGVLATPWVPREPRKEKP